jgi:hypothetical protein
MKRKQTSREERDDFDRFIRENPAVWEAFECYTMALIQKAKRKRYGSMTVLQRCRWDFHIGVTTTQARGEFKIRNAFEPYFARLWRSVHPDLEWIFKYNPSRADDYPWPTEPKL